MELHRNSRQRYRCILQHYGGSNPLAVLVADPSGGAVVSVRRFIASRLAPSSVPWAGAMLTISWMFGMLCLHMFDYVKDIGKPDCNMVYLNTNNIIYIFRYNCHPLPL
jgi:hypothetical protein